MTFAHSDWAKFHKQNPHVYVILKDASQQALWHGADKQAIWKLGQELRWDHEVATERIEAPDDFKVPNGCWAFYARALMALGAVPYGFFDTRPMKHEPKWWLDFVTKQEAAKS